MKKRLPQRSEEVFIFIGGFYRSPRSPPYVSGHVATAGSDSDRKKRNDRKREEVSGGTDLAEELAAVAAR